MAEPLPPGSVILPAPGAIGEGLFVSEIAMRGPRPRYFVARSTKFLAVQTLMGREYRGLFSNGPELMIALDRVPVSMVVLNESVPQKSGKDGPSLT